LFRLLKQPGQCAKVKQEIAKRKKLIFYRSIFKIRGPVSKYYIRQCINGSVNNIKADEIKKDYNTMKKAVENTIYGFLNTTE